MRDPKILLSRLKMIFQAICFLLAIYMSVSFVKRFNDNDNSTSITFKKYSQNPIDKYPTFSVCFKGPLLHWYYDLDIYNAFELRTEKFEMMLQGEPAFKYVYNPSLRLFSKRTAFLSNGSSFDWKKFHLKITDILLEAHFTSLDENNSRIFRNKGSGNSDEPPFTLSYQTPEMICFARDSKYFPNLIRIDDLLILNRRLIESGTYENSEIQILIHYPNQLIQSLAIPSFTSTFSDYQRNKLLSFKMSQSTVIRRRPDYHEPCNSMIQDYDMYLMHGVINKTQCIPPYWMEMITDKPGLEMCTTQEQLKRAYGFIHNWKNVMKENDRPCVAMFNIVGWNWLAVEGEKQSDDIQIKFYYQEQYYQELEYMPDFDLETFISNIGGFVGIFLGYSMMQFPELLGTLGQFSSTSLAAKCFKNV